MSKRTIFCIATSRAQAVRIVDRLLGDGFTGPQICAVSPDGDTAHDFARARHTRTPDCAANGTDTGRVIGCAVGLMAALGGNAIRPIVGGINGVLVGMGLPDLEAKRYEGKLKHGNILLSVDTDSSAEVTRATAVLEHAGAEEICTVSGSSTLHASGRTAGSDVPSAS